MFKRILIGLIITALGTLTVIKTEAIVSQTGLSSWAERHLGSEGGTRLLYKLIGIIAIVIGMLVITGYYGNLLQWAFGPLFNRGF